ncbi:MAG: ATP synthase F1 subunit epsilon [Veillonella sp.]|nr:ATP synthase F1 subunit epsilon [Veillonella sp.]
MAEPMTLTIITPDAIVYDGKADFFVGHAIDGEFGVLPNHAPMIIALDMAPLRVDNPDGQQHTFAVFGGFVEICESPETIDIDRAKRAKERAEGRLSNPTPDIDVERAELALARALLRLKVTQRI